MRYIIIIGAILAITICSCSKSSVSNDNDLSDEFIGKISFGDDSLIVNLNQPLIISFRPDMNHQAVENSLHFQPEFKYSTHWTTEPACNQSDPGCYPDYYQLYIYPENSFRPEITYFGVIDTTAYDILENHLPFPYEFEFTTDSARLLRIEYVTDFSDSSGIYPELINLHFNTAMNISTISEPFTLTPACNYAIYDSAFNNSVISYKVLSALKSETEYTLQITDTNIRDLFGNRIGGLKSSAFVTAAVQVIYHYPNSKFKIKHDRPIIQVRFNTIMDRISTQNAFNFTDGVLIYSGRFEWLTPEAMLFFLDWDLGHAVIYTLTMDTTATDTFGQKLDKPFSYSFMLD